MVLTLILVVFAVIGPQPFKGYYKLRAEVQELRVNIYGVSAFVAIAYAVMWLILGLPRGQYPDSLFGNLWLTACAGVVLTLMALRANKVYKDILHTKS